MRNVIGFFLKKIPPHSKQNGIDVDRKSPPEKINAIQGYGSVAQSRFVNEAYIGRKISRDFNHSYS